MDLRSRVSGRIGPLLRLIYLREIIAVVSFGLEWAGFRGFFLLYIQSDAVSETLLVMERHDLAGLE